MAEGEHSLAGLADSLRRPLLRGPDAAAHERPWRGRPGRALAVALPSDIEEVRATLLWARRHLVRVLPQGAVTGLVGASTPPPEGPAPLVVGTGHLVTGLAIDPAAATAVVPAGLRLSELNEQARPHGLELPIDLAADPCVGGMAATNTGGSRVMRYGDMSDRVLGLQAVLADEQVSVVGDLRGLRKDNTGPDPLRLMLGSSGAFGIITAVAVALSPLPRERATALIGPVRDEAAIGLLESLRVRLGTTLSAFEVMCPTAVRASLDLMDSPPRLPETSDPDVLVLVEVSGDDSTQDRLVESVAGSTLLGSADALLVPPTQAWALRHNVTAGLAARGGVLGFDLSVPPGRLPELRVAVRALVERRRLGWEMADFGHWGDGGIHCNVVVPEGRDAHDADLAGLRRDVYRLTRDLGGSYSAEHGIGPLNGAWWNETTPGEVRALLRSFKDVADPLGIMGHPGIPFA